MKTRLCLGGYLHRTRTIIMEDEFWSDSEFSIHFARGAYLQKRMKYGWDGEYFRCYGFNEFFFSDTDYDDIKNCITEGRYGIRREITDI